MGTGSPTESWADLLRDCKRRGMRAPVLAVGDGALGFWAALREVFPQTREQRDWVHKAANVLDALPKSTHPAARKALAEIRDAEDRQHAEKAITAFANLCGTKHPKAVAKIVDDTEQLLAFYDFPAEHWVHLKTSNPIVIWSSRNDHDVDLRCCDVDGVLDVGAQQGPMIGEICRLGVSWRLPRISAARRSPRAWASA
jgi:transposase-like protein